MRPEQSLIFLTVFASAGQGLFWLTLIVKTFFPDLILLDTVLAAGVLALVFQVLGMMASFFHLGRPSKGILALLKIKNSWLSREVWTLSGFTGLLILVVLTQAYQIQAGWAVFLEWLAAVFSLGFFVSSSMVYASIRFIKEWANGFTFLNFTLLGFFCGLSCLLFLTEAFGSFGGLSQNLKLLFITVLLISFAVKLASLRFNSKAFVSIDTRNAIGSNDHHIRLMDTGAAYETYNTHEYHFDTSSGVKTRMKIDLFVFVYLVPLIGWALTSLFGMQDFSLGFYFLSALSILYGSMSERRLFFIEGNHLQNLYYANFQKSGVPNPLLTKAKKNTPAPLS